MLRLRLRAAARLIVACTCLVTGPLAWRAMADRYIDFGPSDDLVTVGLPPIDQPLVQVALYTQPPTGTPQKVGPTPSWTQNTAEDGYSFLLDSGSSTILSSSAVTGDLQSSHLFQTDATYNEQGVAGFEPVLVSAPYRVDYAGTNGVVSSVNSARILALDHSNDAVDQFDGIAGTPVMVGHNTTLDMTTLPTDFQMAVQFSAAPPAAPTNGGHRYDVPLQMVTFPLTGQQKPTDPLPTNTPLAFAPVKLRNGTHTVEAHFAIDTGAQISLISTAVATALGIDPNTDSIGTVQLGGIGGIVDVPIVNTDSFAIHTREGTDLKWSDLNVAVGDIDPQIAGVLGIDVLSNAWLNAFIDGTDGNLAKVHFDFRNVANMTGDLLLDVDPAFDSVASSDSSTSWDFNGSGKYGDTTMWNSQTAIPNGAGVSITFGNGLLNQVNAQTVIVNIDAPYVVGSIAFTNSLGTSYILANAGGSITLDNKGAGALVSVAPGVTALQQIQANIILADNVTFDIAPASSLSITGGGISETGGSRSITLTYGGLLTLGTANSFTGGATVNNGTLRTTADGALGSGPLAINADDRVVSVVNLGGNETVGGLSGTLTGTGTARVNIAASKTLTVNQSADAVFAGNVALAAGGTPRSGGTLTQSGPNTLEIAGAPSLGNNSNVNVNGGTLRFNMTSASSGTVAIGSSVTATIANSGVMELAGTVSALSAGGNRTHVINNATSPAGLLVPGSNQKVGNIDGAGATQVNAGADLTADHIIQSALVIGGTATSHGLVTIAASGPSGSPLDGAQSGGLGISDSLAGTGPFGGGGTSKSDLPLGAEGFNGDPFIRSGTPSTAGTPAVPEPTTVVVLAIACLSCLPRVVRRLKDG